MLILHRLMVTIAVIVCIVIRCSVVYAKLVLWTSACSQDVLEVRSLIWTVLLRLIQLLWLMIRLRCVVDVLVSLFQAVVGRTPCRMLVG